MQNLEGEIALNIQTNGTVSQLKSTLEQRIDENEQMSDRIKVQDRELQKLRQESKELKLYGESIAVDLKAAKAIQKDKE